MHCLVARGESTALVYCAEVKLIAQLQQVQRRPSATATHVMASGRGTLWDSLACPRKLHVIVILDVDSMYTDVVARADSRKTTTVEQWYTICPRCKRDCCAHYVLVPSSSVDVVVPGTVCRRGMVNTLLLGLLLCGGRGALPIEVAALLEHVWEDDSKPVEDHQRPERHRSGHQISPGVDIH